MAARRCRLASDRLPELVITTMDRPASPACWMAAATPAYSFSTVMQHAILVEQQRIVALDDFGNPPDAAHHAGTTTPIPRQASIADPAAASSCVATLKGTAIIRCLILVQRVLRAPPPTVRSDWSGEAPISASRR